MVGPTRFPAFGFPSLDIVKQRGGPDNFQVRPLDLGDAGDHFIHALNVIISMNRVSVRVPGPGLFQCWHRNCYKNKR